MPGVGTRTLRRAEGSVSKKRNLWYAVLTIGRDAAGRQIRQWSRGFETRRKAEHHLAQLLIEERQAKETEHTLEFVVSEYIRHDVTSRGKRSPTTTERYRGLFANMALLHKERVDRLTGAKIEQFFDRELESGRSPTTVHHIYNLMFAAFRWAKRKKVGLITRNAFETDDIERPRRAKSNAESLTVEQAQTVLESIVRTKHADAIVFSLATAIRRGETCGMKWTSVDLKRRVATVKESRYQVPRKQGQKSTKADRIREVPLNDTAMRALAREQKRQDKRRKEAGDAWTETGHVFTDELGLPLSPMALTNAFSHVAKRAGLPIKRLHVLRHTGATLILSGGGSLAAASQILGHSEKSTTANIYGHVIGADSLRASRLIDRALVSRQTSRPRAKAKKKPRKRAVSMVAPTGIEPDISVADDCDLSRK